jgi:hypothetical protein
MTSLNANLIKYFNPLLSQNRFDDQDLTTINGSYTKVLKRVDDLCNQINSRLNWDFDELLNLVATSLSNEIILSDQTLNSLFFTLPDSIKNRCMNTNGQILYKDQAAFIYSLFAGVNLLQAEHWVQNWNKKEPAARNIVHQLVLGGITLAEVIDQLAAYKNNYFFVEKPIGITLPLYQYLDNRKILTKGNLNIRTLKIGDLLYEYKNLVESYWVGFQQYKIYKRCIVSIVVELPKRESNASWSWTVERIHNNEMKTYSVYEDTSQGSPYIYNNKQWDAQSFE